MNSLQKIDSMGQSIWLDFISRKTIQDGTLQKYIDEGVVGMTSNPAIFEKAMSGPDYDKEIGQLALEGKSKNDIYEELVVEDVQSASDLLRPVYNSTHGLDGYVSLEVSPTLARNTQGTIAEAKSYWGRLARPNVMIKIPATVEGVPAVSETISNGTNVNVTLLFSVKRYEAIFDSYMKGLEMLAEKGGDITKIRSVASFFLSRIDTMVDEDLEKIGTPEALKLRGKTAIACAKLAYELFEQKCASPRWQALKSKGAHPQRLLWASTSTKNKAYSDVLYVDALIAPETVNTLPQETITAYLDHGKPEIRIHNDLDQVKEVTGDLAKVGIDLTDIANRLEEDGLKKFVDPYHKLEALLETKRKAAVESDSKDEKAVAQALAASVAGL